MDILKKLVFILLSTQALTLAKSTLEVKAPSGTYTGIINGTAPNVRQFLRVPFAEPPVGARRFMPPERLKTNSTTHHDATYFPPSCAQYVSSVPSYYGLDVPEYTIFNYNQNRSAGAFAEATAEDCLYLAIWTPANEPVDLPVIVFVTGGGFFSGGIHIPYQLPHRWVERTQNHIVVTINYRMNILGFPNATALPVQNPGLLDMRMALEWVRENIQAFGGDVNKITLWGQSVGGKMVDFHNFAFPDDPIAAGTFTQSGNAIMNTPSFSAAHGNFSFVASELGCRNLSSVEELMCMQNVSAQDILNLVGRHQDSRASPTNLMFLPVADEKYVFSNYTERYHTGAIAQIPVVYGTTKNEGVSMEELGYPEDPEIGLNQTAVEDFTHGIFRCSAAQSARLRTQRGLTSFRYEFAGNFSNVSPQKWLGAYHSADLPFLFGTHADFRGNSTPRAYQVSEAMQDFLYGFMTNPNSPTVRGLEVTEWPQYHRGSLLVFGSGEDIVQEVRIDDVERGVGAVPGSCGSW